ncbi:hypothetical protein pb186bvf_002446 [Paramecium bursaria]
MINLQQKIKIIRDIQDKPQQRFQIQQIQESDKNRQPFFKDLLDDTIRELEDLINDNQLQIEALKLKNCIDFQNWEIKFRGQKIYENKMISGILRFPNKYPEVGPQFSFSLVPDWGDNSGYPTHENIYGDGRLCLPMITKWSNAPIYEIIKAVIELFHEPQNEDAANQKFALLDEEDKIKIRKRLALHLPNYE